MKALAYGEVLWDIIGENAYIGGATFNVAAHLAQFGCEASMLSRLGADELGDRAIGELARLRMDARFVQRDPDRETGKAIVYLDETNTATYDLPIAAYDAIACDDDLIAQLKEARFDVFIYGTLASRVADGASRQTLRRILDEVPFGRRFYDINIRKEFYDKDLIALCFSKADIAKINDEEALLVADLLYGTPMSEAALAERLRKDYDIAVVIVTRGGAGCSVYDESGACDLPGHKVEVVDTVGAGDSFSATFLYHSFRGASASESARLGNRMGAFVASQAGAVPTYPDELTRELGLL